MLTQDQALAKEVTGEEVKAVCLSKGIRQIRCRQCSICQSWLNYEVVEPFIFFDSSCDCTNFNGWYYRSWDDAARLINMQTAPEAKLQYMRGFGFAIKE